MKDYLGVELEIGDEVIYHSQHYRCFHKGRVVRWTPKMVIIDVTPNDATPYHECSDNLKRWRELRQHPSQLIRITKELWQQ